MTCPRRLPPVVFAATARARRHRPRRHPDRHREPTSALDVTVQAQVLELFESLRERFGFRCVFVSHDLAVVHRLSDRVVVLRQGRVVEHGSADRVLLNPEQEYTRRLVAAVPVPDPVVQRRRRAS